MRKPFGIIALIIGLVIVIFSIRTLMTDAATARENRAKIAQLNNGIPGLFTTDTDKSGHKEGVYFMMGLGILLSVSGVIMIRSGQKKEAERLAMQRG